MKKSYKNNKFIISAPTLNEHFESPDGSYSVSDIQQYFEYKYKKNTEKRLMIEIILQLNVRK